MGLYADDDLPTWPPTVLFVRPNVVEGMESSFVQEAEHETA